MRTDAPTLLDTLPPAATSAQIKKVTDRDGGAIVSGLLSPEEVARINAELDPLLALEDPTSGYSEEESRAAFYGRQTRRLQSVAARSNAVLPAIVNDRMLAWVASNLTWGREFSLNSAEVIEIGPGQNAQVLHRDEDLWPELVAVAPGEFTVTCMLALSDYTEAVGATRVVPGTRRAAPGGSAASEAYTQADTVPAVMSAGDALFFTGTVVHGGGANTTTDQWRRGLALSFIVGWARTEEAHTLAITVERARELSPRLRELLGFAAYRNEMGEIGQLEMGDPYPKLFNEPRPPL